eukprot:119833-Prorocentrum_minimum.AAC.2
MRRAAVRPRGHVQVRAKHRLVQHHPDRPHVCRARRRVPREHLRRNVPLRALRVRRRDWSG